MTASEGAPTPPVERSAEWIAAVEASVAAAPPLSESQRARLRLLFAPPESPRPSPDEA